MHDPLAPPPPGHPTTTILCPAHGLRFNPTITSGCIRCRSSAPPPPSSTGPLILGLVALIAFALFGGAAWIAFTPRPPPPVSAPATAP